MHLFLPVESFCPSRPLSKSTKRTFLRRLQRLLLKKRRRWTTRRSTGGWNRITRSCLTRRRRTRNGSLSMLRACGLGGWPARQAPFSCLTLKLGFFYEGKWNIAELVAQIQNAWLFYLKELVEQHGQTPTLDSPKAKGVIFGIFFGCLQNGENCFEKGQNLFWWLTFFTKSSLTAINSPPWDKLGAWHEECNQFKQTISKPNIIPWGMQWGEVQIFFAFFWFWQKLCFWWFLQMKVSQG